MDSYKHILTARAATIRAQMKRYSVTRTLILINVAVFLLETVLGGSTRTRIALLFGAQYLPLLEEGQIWRLLTSIFLHFGFIHLACNMFALYSLGCGIEQIYGRSRFLVIYFVSGLVGNLLTWVLDAHFHADDPAVSAGASGAIFGLMGAYTALFLIPSMRERLSVRGIVSALVINLAYGLTYSGINMAAHIGGFIGGAVISALLIAWIRWKGDIHATGR